ncbi:DUF805 domain-containing protein [Pseudomonas sp. AA-38]|uniref:DUF805 domain-containing protein n=1 Tax=Pseudomonas sp. AA-38 TaxID=3028807 RepID=UPI0023F80444|nr:DUF805 domain-containing protein [Pseudomonas sp. AA-38]
MNPPRYKILFDGQLMPNATLETVKDNLARLFKSDRARIDALFSGAVVTLKKDLPEQQADQYLDALQKAGAKVRKELDQAIGLSLVQTEDHPEEPAPDTASQARMTCPKCGHEQTKAAECSACGIIIEKYMARQAQLAATTVTPVQEASSPYAPPRADVAENLPQFGELKVLSLSGRIGRVRYLGWYMAMLLCMLPGTLLAINFGTFSSTLFIIIFTLMVVGILVFSFCLVVQRLHDMGWSGWLWLLFFVPLVGTVMSLLMLIVPGTQGVNRYGPPPPPNSTSVTVLAWLVLLLPIIGIAAAISLPHFAAPPIFTR